MVKQLEASSLVSVPPLSPVIMVSASGSFFLVWLCISWKFSDLVARENILEASWIYIFILGFTGNCWKTCDSWCNDRASKHFRTQGTSAACYRKINWNDVDAVCAYWMFNQRCLRIEATSAVVLHLLYAYMHHFYMVIMLRINNDKASAWTSFQRIFTKASRIFSIVCRIIVPFLTT